MCHFAEPSSIALQCSSEPDARGYGGSSGADAELCIVGGEIAMSFGGEVKVL